MLSFALTVSEYQTSQKQFSRRLRSCYNNNNRIKIEKGNTFCVIITFELCCVWLVLHIKRTNRFKGFPRCSRHCVLSSDGVKC